MVVGDMGLVDIDLGCDPMSYHLAQLVAVIQTILPNPHLPRQNLADSGMTTITINSTHVPDHHCQPMELGLLTLRSDFF